MGKLDGHRQLNNARPSTRDVALRGFVLVAGGNSAGGGFLASAELYNAGPPKAFGRPDTGGRINRLPRSLTMRI